MYSSRRLYLSSTGRSWDRKNIILKCSIISPYKIIFFLIGSVWPLEAPPSNRTRPPPETDTDFVKISYEVFKSLDTFRSELRDNDSGKFTANLYCIYKYTANL